MTATEPDAPVAVILGVITLPCISYFSLYGKLFKKMLAKKNESVTVLGIMNVSDMARALGRMGKGKKKTMSEAALAQRRAAAQQRKKKSHKTMKAAVLFLLFTATITLAQQVNPVNPVVNADRVVLLKGRVAGDMKVWLVVEAHNAYEWTNNGYDPCLTRVVVDYKPMFRKLPNGQWEICFVSPIAERLP